MKINKILCLALLLLSVSSCSKWLTIYPEDQVAEEELYATAEGFYNQLNGVYRTMAEGEMYGREMTWGYVDALAQYYDGSTMRFADFAAYLEGAAKYDHKHSSALGIITNIWEKGYNAIANCNDIIEHTIEADSTLFPEREVERKLILGEAYALRAVLHFDILRLYAPAPVKGNATDKHIPYVNKFGEKINNPVTNQEVLNNVIADLELAEQLTAAYDTLNTRDIRTLSYRLELPTSAKRFLGHRGYRLNLYAIKAMIARVSLYAGDKEKALKYSEELINLKWFSFTSSSNFGGTRNNKKLYDDVIFALYNNKQKDVYLTVNESNDKFLTVLNYDGIFGGDFNDYRAKQWENVETTDYGIQKRSLKTTELTETTDWTGKEKYCNIMIPMIRISEMYYIAAECLFELNSAKAYEYLKAVKKGRGAITEINQVHTQDDFNQLILLDARREFQMEGQLFFFYKRLNLRVFIKDGDLKTLDKEFVLPIPLSNDIN